MKRQLIDPSSLTDQNLSTCHQDQCNWKNTNILFREENAKQRLKEVACMMRKKKENGKPNVILDTPYQDISLTK